MGFISDFLGSSDIKGIFPSAVSGREMWRQVFGPEKSRVPPAPPEGPGWGRSSSYGTSVATRRLLETLRSGAPGGWTDNRWEQSKHFTGIQFVCIARTCEMLSESEFSISIRDENHPDGKRPVPRYHDGYKLYSLLEKPNKQDSFGDLAYNWNLQMDLTGSSITWMVPNMLGMPMEMYPIATAVAIPQATINPEFPEGWYRIQPLYPYGPFSSYPTPSTSVGAPIDARWVLKFKYPHPLLRYEGYSPLTALNHHIDCIEAMDKSRWYMMKRSVRPSVVVNMDDMEGAQPLPEEEIERIHAEWENSFQGPENHGKILVAPPGGSISEFGRAPADMEYQSGWDQLVSFVMAGFGITKPAAGMVEDNSYSTLFATLKQFHLLTLEPKCKRFSAGLTRQLAPFFGDDLIIDIKCKRVDDHDIDFTKIDKGIMAKCITKNEVRKLLGMSVVMLPWGEEIAGMDPMPPGMPANAQAMPGQMPGQMGQMPPQQMGQQGFQQLGAGNLNGQANPSAPPELVQQLGYDPMTGMGEAPKDIQMQPEEVTTSRQRAGKLAHGAFGPRMPKAMPKLGASKLAMKYGRKSLSYLDEIREVKEHTNGNGTHTNRVMDLLSKTKSLDLEFISKSMYDKVKEALDG